MDGVNIMQKKIIFVISRMGIGGSQKSLVNALNILDYDNYDVTVYIRENKTDLLKEIPKEARVVVNTDNLNYDHDIICLCVEALKRCFKWLHFKRAADACDALSRNYFVRKRQKNEMKHYIVLSDSYDLAISYLQGYTCKFVADNIKAKKKICFYHNSTNSTYELHKKYLPKFDEIVTVNANTAKMLEAVYENLKGKVSVIQNILNVEDVRHKACEFAIEEKREDIILCSCGRISKEKGYDLAVEAAKILSDKGLKFKWYLVGDGPERSKIDNMISQYGISDRVIVTGLKENPCPWILHCDIYVQPSYEEAQGLSMMEAQILCKPVVSTSTVGGCCLIKDGETGVITEISASGIASGIMRLLNDSGEMNRITENLKKIDYTTEKERYKKQWKAILEQA